jgi:hypothetical protein
MMGENMSSITGTKSTSQGINDYPETSYIPKENRLQKEYQRDKS